MKRDCIKDFIDSWLIIDGQINQFVYMEIPTVKTKAHQWNIRFREAGYYCVQFNNRYPNWGEIYSWCSNNIGIEHFAWLGNTFWFETEQDKSWFLLRWS